MNLSLIPPQLVGPNQSMLDKSILNMTDPGLSRVTSARPLVGSNSLNGFNYPSLEELRELYFKKGKRKESKKEYKINDGIQII